MNRYEVITKRVFEEELDEILNYIIHILKEPKLAIDIYNEIINYITSLEYFPKRYYQIPYYSIERKNNIRRMVVKKFIILYEVDDRLSQVNILHIFHGNQNYLNQL